MTDELPPNEGEAKQPPAEHTLTPESGVHPPGQEAAAAPGALSEQPVDGVADPAAAHTSSSEHPMIVDDKDLAHDMALVGDSRRREAAEIRRDVVAEKRFKDRLYEIINDPRYLDESFRHRLSIFIGRNPLIGSPTRPAFVWGRPMPDKVSDQAIDNLKRLDEETDGGNENPDISWSNSYRPTRAAKEVFLGSYDPSSESFRATDLKRARKLDELAHRDEEWVRLLHDKPVDAAYKAEHPDFGFGPYEMSKLETLVERADGLSHDEEYLQEGLFEDPEKLSLVNVVNAAESAISTYCYLMFNAEENEEAEALVDAYEKAVTNENTTLRDLVDLNERIRKQHNAAMKAKIEERKQVLEDVKSGRAGQPPEPTGLQEAA